LRVRHELQNVGRKLLTVPDFFLINLSQNIYYLRHKLNATQNKWERFLSFRVFSDICHRFPLQEFSMKAFPE